MGLKQLVITGYFLMTGLEISLYWLNIAHQKRGIRQLPAELAVVTDAGTIEKALRYGTDKTLLASWRKAAFTVLFAWFLFGPWLEAYDAWTNTLSHSFVIKGTLFYLGLLLAKTVLDMPFDLYRTFSIEKRYRFNTTSATLWLGDTVKSTLLSLVFTGLLSASGLYLVQNSPRLWWLWVWILVVFFTLLIMVVSPRLLEPLFFKLTPITRSELETRIRHLAEKTGVRPRGIWQVDASRRSSHANAYFTGFGPQKRIVLFDTLLEQLNDVEIIAVLAHEIGHWRLHHLRRRLRLGVATSLISCILAYLALQTGSLRFLFTSHPPSFVAQTLFLLLLGGIAATLLQPLLNGWSRRHEWQADRFACAILDQPRDLASALAKLARNNLANLCPHPLFAKIYFPHPPIVDRIQAIHNEYKKQNLPGN